MDYKKEKLILGKIRKKSKKIIEKQVFTEFFFINKNRKVIEFLKDNNETNLEFFFKNLIKEEFRSFVKLKIYNCSEEEIETWYYDEENLVLAIEINFGKKKQQNSIEININNFVLTSLDNWENSIIFIDFKLLNNFLITFLKSESEKISRVFNKLK